MAVDNARHGAVSLVADGIADFLRQRVQLGQAGQKLLCDGIVGIGWIDQRQQGGRNRDGIFARDKFYILRGVAARGKTHTHCSILRKWRCP